MSQYKKNRTQYRLVDVVKRSIIICYNENIDQLYTSLKNQKLSPTQQRAVYTAEEDTYAKSTKTFLNHKTAWEVASLTDGYTLVCESDFVPCKDLGQFPVFWPTDNPRAWGYLYTGSPRLLGLVGDQKYMRAHCAPLVAYVVNPHVANVLLHFYENELKTLDPTQYSTFDAHLQWFAMGHGAEAYMPMRHYGEHGGLPNVEHQDFGKLPRAGRHRADNLFGPLAFLPQYAFGSWTRFWMERLEARAYGWARLVTGRWWQNTNVYNLTSREKLKMFAVGVKRLL